MSRTVAAAGLRRAASMVREGGEVRQGAPRRQAASVGKALLDLHPRRQQRRVWTRAGHAHIEVRGLDRVRGRERVARGVTGALRRLKGVRWAEINAATGQVLLAFDEHRVSLDLLLDTVTAVERAEGVHDEGFSWDRPTPPGDDTPIAAAAVALVADGVASATAIVGRILPVPALLPTGARLTVAVLEVEHDLRVRLERRIGPAETDMVLALASAVVYGLSQGVAHPAVDGAHRLMLLAERLARRQVWRRRESELGPEAVGVPHRPPELPPRSRSLPPGPVEKWRDILGPAAPCTAAGVLALTRSPRRAASALLAAVPEAAIYGREGFATAVGVDLARRDVLPLDSRALRRLDRVRMVVFDASVLTTAKPLVLVAQPEPGVSVARLWQAGARALSGLSMGDLDGGGGWWERDGCRLERLDAAGPGTIRGRVLVDGRPLGQVTIGREVAPLAEAVLDAARASGATVLLTEWPSAEDLLPLADQVVDGGPLVDRVRALQDEGHGVLVVSATDQDALAAADVAVAVPAPNAAYWTADLVCRTGLEDVWRILRALGAARDTSARSVRLAKGGSALGVLLSTIGKRRHAGWQAHAPVHAAALTAMLRGALAGLRATRAASPRPIEQVPWHALDAAEVFTRLQGQAECTARRTAPTGPRGTPVPGRRLVEATLRAPVLRPAVGLTQAAVSLAGAVREELRDPLTPVLAVGATASAIVGSGVDALLVGSVMAGNAVISGVQRQRADRALRRLLMGQEVTARRVSEPVRGLGRLPELATEVVPAHELAAGDVIALRAADVVPADARLLLLEDLEVDESPLTGESLPVAKEVAATPGAPLTERTCMVFDGTSVLAGSGYAVVVASGAGTYAGRTAHLAGRAASRVGVQAQLTSITRSALPVTGFGGAAVTALGLLRGVSLRQTVAAGVSVAVAAVPEGLPLVATVAQTGVARRLSRHDVLARASRTLEALGRVDTVCFDKTGTLTRGRLALTRVAAPSGAVADDTPAGRAVLTAAGRASPPVSPDEVAAAPHATDRAVLRAAERGGTYRQGWTLLNELPFETSRGYSAALGTDDGGPLLVVKGAPEVVLPRCPAVHPDASRTVRRLAAEGLRVLAVAERRRGVPADRDDLEPLVGDLTLLGFLGLADELHPHAAEAVAKLTSSGVRVVMLTGDHPVTARAVAGDLGMTSPEVLSGADLDRMTDREGVDRIERYTTFARVSPAHKVRIVDALQRAGHVVAMTGDGVNDAAAIRTADVGIGVSAHGSTSARFAADLVLADGDIRRVHQALLEGRALWRRISDAIAILLGGNAGEVAFMVIGSALTGRAPMTTRQMLVVNMLTDMFPALAIALAPRRHGEAEQAEHTDGHAVSPLGAPLVEAVAIRGAATTVGAMSAWTVGRLTGRRRRAGSMGLAALVTTQLGQTLLSGWHSPLVVATCLTSFLVLFAVVETPGVSQFFGSTPLGPLAWATVMASAAGGTLLAALAPHLLRRLATELPLRTDGQRPTAARATPQLPPFLAAVMHRLPGVSPPDTPGATAAAAGHYPLPAGTASTR